MNTKLTRFFYIFSFPFFFDGVEIKRRSEQITLRITSCLRPSYTCTVNYLFLLLAALIPHATEEMHSKLHKIKAQINTLVGTKVLNLKKRSTSDFLPFSKSKDQNKRETPKLKIDCVPSRMFEHNFFVAVLFFPCLVQQPKW